MLNAMIAILTGIDNNTKPINPIVVCKKNITDWIIIQETIRETAIPITHNNLVHPFPFWKLFDSFFIIIPPYVVSITP